MPPPTSQPHGSSPPPALRTTSRRHVLLGMAAAGVAVVGGVAACGSNEPSGATQPETPDGSPTTQRSPGSTGSPSETATAEGGDNIAKTADIPVGGGMIFADQRVVVTQPSSGTFRAFSAVCTHQGCTVGTVRDGLITCPCHGSQFRVDDGSVARGPAASALPQREVMVQDGNIVVS